MSVKIAISLRIHVYQEHKLPEPGIRANCNASPDQSKLIVRRKLRNIINFKESINVGNARLKISLLFCLGKRQNAGGVEEGERDGEGEEKEKRSP